MTKKDPRFLCVLPWIQQSLYPNADAYPCCLMVNEYSLGKYPNIDSEKLTTLKQTMLSDQVPTSCRECHKHESSGIKSYREHANQTYPKAYQEILEQGSTDLIRLELRLSNRCNFSCRTCNAGNSTGWYQDAKFLGNKEKLKELNLLEIAGPQAFETLLKAANKVQELHFMGGEPLLQPEHFELIEKLENRAHKSLFYVTNLSHFSYSLDQISQLWGGFKEVHWDVSLDALGERAEIIRKGIKWDLFEKNLKFLISLSEKFPFKVGVSLTISALNYGELTEVLQYCHSLGLSRITINIVSTPDHYSVQALSVQQKREARKKIENYLLTTSLNEDHQSNLRGLMSFAESRQDELLEKKFQQITQLINTIRSENFTV